MPIKDIFLFLVHLFTRKLPRPRRIFTCFDHYYLLFTDELNKTQDYTELMRLMMESNQDDITTFVTVARFFGHPV